jgi:hypothetical protein
MHDIFIVNQCNNHDYLTKRFPHARVIEPASNRKELYTQVSKMGVTEHAWVLDDRYDYTDFDLTYRSPWHQNEQLHVWPGVAQTLGGDTVLINRLEFLKQVSELDAVQNYQSVAWKNQTVCTSNRPEIFVWSNSNTSIDGTTKLRRIGSELDMMIRTLRKAKTNNIWIISDTCDYTDFNFDWRPEWEQEEYLHVWPTEGQTSGGDTMYVNVSHAKAQLDNIENLENYNTIRWHNQNVKQKVKPLTVAWSRSGTSVEGADITLRYLGNELDMMKRTLRKIDTPYFWIISDTCDYTDFDFNWRPGWSTQHQLHVWPTDNQDKGGDTMYVNTVEAKSQTVALEYLEQYAVINWHTQRITQKTKPQIVAWSHSGNTVEGADFTLRYLGSELDMMTRTLRKVKTPSFWVISDTCDYTDFDFEYKPGWTKQSYLHVWPTENQTKGGDTMYVDTVHMMAQLTELKELEHYDVIDWHSNSIKQMHTPEVFVWDSTGNKDCFPGATVLRNVGDKYSMLEKTVRRASTPYIWILNSNNNYTDFDFNWRPSWATQNHLHVWPSGTQTHGGDTMYVNVIEFKKQALEMQALEQYVPINWHNTVVEQTCKPDIVIWDGGDNTAYIKERFPDAKVMRNIGSRYDMMCRTMRHVNSNTAWIINSKCDYSEFDFDWRPNWANETQLHVWPTENQIKGGDTYYVDVCEFKKQSLEITELDQYNSVNWHKQSLRLQTTSDIVIWTFGGNENNLDNIKKQYPNAKSLRYVGTHLEMVKKSAKYVNTDYFWVLSDCCDYTEFDANWRPDWETENSIHCWASGEQKFGDTFYVPKKQFLQEADDVDKLEYYSSIIWHSDGYSRLPWHINYIETGDIYSAITSHQFQNIYEYFVAPGSTLESTVDPNLWEKRHLIAYNKNGHVSLCPRDAIGSISDRLASYPYIQYHNCENSKQKAQDIVFISYDEKDADLNYELLLKRFPLAKRIHGVKGNVNAYKAAAKISNTPWYYAVFPKTKIDPDFGCNHHPNYLETPGHYIFNAHNVITDYAYGHGGVKMYHVKTTIEIENWGYDFTLSSPVTVIPVNSCYLVPASPYEAWRTSFREVLKLKDNTTVEGLYRLNRWLTGNHAEFGEYSMKGAADALKFDGDVTIANSWEWLREQFNSRYN